MKKFLLPILIFSVSTAMTAHAAWQFDEKTLDTNADGTRLLDGVIETYRLGYSGKEEHELGYQYYSLSGEKLENYKKTVSSPVTDTNGYFTRNKLSIVTNDSNGVRLTDLSGTVLASGFELSNIWEQNDVARKVKKNGRYGIMAYDGRMIIPMENDGAVIYDNNIYAAVNGSKVSVYNYYGNHLFTLDDNIEIVKAGADWISVHSRDTNKYALVNYKGDYLTDLKYDFISIYDNNAPWQSGPFAVLYENSSETYINRSLKEIDIYSEADVYCQSYSEYQDIAIINNATQFKNAKTAVYNKSTGSYIIPFRDGITYSNSEVMIYSYNNNSYISDLYGNNPRNLNHHIYSISSFVDGLADVNHGKAIYDTYGNNIFSKQYRSIERIDNNEFLVLDGSAVKILTAKGIVGEALYTDIKIDINGVKIPCRSVYGYAGVIAEDLRFFGFDVIWDNNTRLLSITRNPAYHSITPTQFPSAGVPGTHFADIYGSDINVEFNGMRIPSYCIDGQTIIKVEDLASEGISFRYDNSVRTLFMSVEGLEQK